VDRVSSCSREEGESARCSRVSLGCSSTMISFCRRVSDCEELESDKLEGAEESDIVKIWMRVACSVLEMAGALKDGKCF
jgi:hypothetical protein